MIRTCWHCLLTLGLGLFVLGCDTNARTPADGATSARFESGDPRLLPPATVGFVEGYYQGYAAANQQGKPLMAFFTSDACRFCREMVQTAFTDQDVIRLSERFVCVRVDADLEADVCREFRIEAFPTVVFLSPRGVPLNRFTGRRSGAELATEMQDALDATARRAAYNAREYLR